MAKKKSKTKQCKSPKAETHQVITTYTFDDFKKLCTYIARGRIRKCDIIVIATYLIIATIALYQKDYPAIALYLLFIPLVMGGSRLLLHLGFRGVWRANKDAHNLKTTYTFYADSYNQKNKFNERSYRYDELLELVETKTHFYLMTAKNQGAIIKKSDCDARTISFLQHRIDKMNTKN